MTLPPEPTPERAEILYAAVEQLQRLFRTHSLAQITPGDVRRIYERHGVQHKDEREDIANHVILDILGISREGPLTSDQERAILRMWPLLIP